MAERWFVARGKSEAGPYSAARLKEFASLGRILPTDLIFMEGMTKRLPASQIKGLLPTGKSVPPPLPVPFATPAELDEILAEANATYRGGHPAFSEKATGVLCLGSRSLTFASDQPRWNVTVRYEHLEDILEPAKGEFPEEMVRLAQATQSAASVGKMAAGFAGSMLGGFGGKLVKAAGATAAQAAKQSTSLGSPPKNRVLFLLRDGHTLHKVIFDFVGNCKDEMEQEALAFWRNVAKVRHLMNTPVLPGVPTPQALGGAAEAGNVYRVMKGGATSPPLSAEDVRKRLESGVLSPSDSICMPLSHFLALSGEPCSSGDLPRSGSGGLLDLSVKLSASESRSTTTYHHYGASRHEGVVELEETEASDDAEEVEEIEEAEDSCDDEEDSSDDDDDE